MRISTPLMYDQSIKNIQNRQEQLIKLQTQLSAGKNILSPSDDPVGSAKVLNLQQTQNVNQHYSENSASASDALALMESALGDAVSTLQNIKSATIQAGNSTLSAEDRKTIAQQIDQAFQHIMSTANTQNSEGEYIFAGYSTSTKPFSETATGQVMYHGDQGQRNYQVSPSLQLPVTENGFNIFQQIPAGNGVFLTSVGAANTGSGAIDSGNVVDPSQLTGDNYTLTFTVTPPQNAGEESVTTYSVMNTTTNQPVIENEIYQPNTAIEFDGVSFVIQGAPADGDNFSVDPANNQSVFSTLSQISQALLAPQNSATEKAAFQNNFSTALAGLDQALSHIVTAQGVVGAYMKQADDSKTMADDLDVQYASQLSQLTELDYTKAISDYSQQQVYLEAAQKTFVQIQGLSLFNFIS